ncbi:MAG: hypothetical protein JNM93_00135 [Bacteriovoracaceae bacterium]|nr:hypothetical protein [Bacteriovoracaceae bacterium]
MKIKKGIFGRKMDKIDFFSINKIELAHVPKMGSCLIIDYDNYCKRRLFPKYLFKNEATYFEFCKLLQAKTNTFVDNKKTLDNDPGNKSNSILLNIILPFPISILLTMLALREEKNFSFLYIIFFFALWGGFSGLFFLQDKFINYLNEREKNKINF